MKDRFATQDRPRLAGAPWLRLVLVLALFCCQSAEVSNSFGRLARVAWLLPHVFTAGLFALAGLLSMHSLAVHGVARFLRHRAAGLMPILAVAVIVPALVIGPLLSVRPAPAYFADPELWSYFLNLLFWPQFTLPGVFLLNTVARIVNDILWTLPAALAAVLLLCTTAIRPQRRAAVLAGLLAGLVASALAVDRLPSDPALVNKAVGAVAAFMLGALGAVLRPQRAPRLNLAGKAAVAVAAAAVIAIALLGQRSWLLLPGFNLGLALPVAAGTVLLSGLAVRVSPVVAVLYRYAGGVFLLAWPVQQSVMALGSANQGFIANMAVSLPATLVVAALSWHLLQRRVTALAIGREAVGAASASAGPSLSWMQMRRTLAAELPVLGLWAVFLAVALSVMAITVFAFRPDRGGI